MERKKEKKKNKRKKRVVPNPDPLRTAAPDMRGEVDSNMNHSPSKRASNERSDTRKPPEQGRPRKPVEGTRKTLAKGLLWEIPLHLSFFKRPLTSHQAKLKPLLSWKLTG